MPEIGLFPLELVLLPSERVPLHIFEERYRELVGESLADGAEFGLILEDDDGLRQVGTRTGVIELVHTFDDGRMNVLVEGRERFRIVRRPRGGRTGRPRWSRSRTTPARSRATRRPRARSRSFRRLAAVAEADEVEVPTAVGGTPLSFQLAARVDFGTVLKQELLELRSERARLDRLVDLLDAGRRGARARARGPRAGVRERQGHAAEL